LKFLNTTIVIRIRVPFYLPPVHFALLRRKGRRVDFYFVFSSEREENTNQQAFQATIAIELKKEYALYQNSPLRNSDKIILTLRTQRLCGAFFGQE
jgi:hypothetical protein